MQVTNNYPYKNRMEWSAVLRSPTSIESALRLIVAAILFVWILLEASTLDRPYPHSIVDLYALPFTRLFLLFFVILSAIWCPRVGILAATAYTLLAADLNFFLH